ncbi:unnamed protein product [Cuscuta campestris]|uniref:Uncharacterized protein n=2 Tax=Cuscuta campestris TaxID=132261 RepID=A0A484N536_9ASTE|nr:unnamed protein product [Cuscuta campestris]
MIAAQELSEFLQMEIRLKFEEEVLEFYRNGEVKTAHSKKNPQMTFPVIKSTVGGTKVKLSQKKLGEKLRLPNSGVEVGKFPVKNLDWNIIGISGQVPSGPAKKADLNNNYKLVLELVIACLECGSGGHADDITQERAFIINSLITKTKKKKNPLTKSVFSKDTEDQVVFTSEAQGVLEAAAEDFQTLPETSHVSEMVLTEVVEEKATSPPQEQNQETAEEEEFQPLIQSHVLEILTTPCEISNPTEIEIPEKSAEIPEQSALPETMEQAVEAQRNSGEAEKETQMAELEIPQPGPTNPLSSKRMNFRKWPDFWAEASGLPLYGLVRDIYCRFGFAPSQLTANAHNLFPHPQAPIFERVESKIDKWAHRYFVIEFPVHSPIDLPGVVRRSSISRTRFAAIPLVDAAYNALREERGLISHHSLQDARLYKKADFYYPPGPNPIPFEGVSSPERSKAPLVVESNPAGSSSGNQAQGNSTALAICKPAAALEAIPISAIPGLRRPTPSRKRPREGVTDDDFLPKKNKGDGTPASPSPMSTSSCTQNTTPAAASRGLELPHPDSLDREGNEPPDEAALKRPAVQPQIEVNNISPPTATTPQGVEEEAERQKEPEAQQSLLTLTKEYLGGAWGNYRAVMVLKEKELAARALQQKVDFLEQQVQALQGENAKLKAEGLAELMAERSRVKSLQEQIAIYQRGTRDLETQFDKL